MRLKPEQPSEGVSYNTRQLRPIERLSAVRSSPTMAVGVRQNRVTLLIASWHFSCLLVLTVRALGASRYADETSSNTYFQR